MPRATVAASIRLSPEEHARITELAKAEGLSFNAYVLAVLARQGR